MRILQIFVKNTVFEKPMAFLPLGLAYIRSALCERGYDVDFIDMSEYDEDSQGKHIDRYPDVSYIPLDYDLYLVSGTSPQASEIRKVGRYLKEKGKPAIAGGPHVTNYAGPETPRGSLMVIDDSLPVDKELVTNYPVMVKYEGEIAIFEAVERIEEGMGALRRHGRGIVLRTPLISDLGSIPIPDRRDAHKYEWHLEDKNGKKCLGTNMFTSRGCPKRCAFCDSGNLWTRGVRYTPIDRVREEFAQIKGLGFEAIQFYDDIFLLNRSRMIEMCKSLKEMGFAWKCYIRVDIVSHHLYGKEFLQMMYNAGLIEVLVGVESGSQQILDNIYKDTTVEQNSIVRQWCREVGIRFKAAIVLGLPGETTETLEATRRWILEQRPDKCAVAIFIPFSGTPIVDQKIRRRYGIDDMHDFDIKIELEPGEAADDHFNYGSRTKLQSVVSTSSLTAQQITDFYLEFSAELDALGITY